LVAPESKCVIALDAMGGDNAPRSVLLGADLFLKTVKKSTPVSFILYGDRSELEPILASLPRLREACELTHTTESIAADEKPSVALRKSKQTSMRLAIEAVKHQEAQAVVSAGNTGALMAISKLVLRPLPGIDRPAIASLFPTRSSQCTFLDLGANVDCNADNLIQFAIMGDAFAKVLLGIKSPKVGLLNVGVEETKGSEVVRMAAEEIRDGGYPLNFHGYIEGDDIAEGTVDVVVTDGFTGNIALKMAEGTARICGAYVKQALRSSPLAMLGGLLALRSFKRTFNKLDPRLHNGAMFLGLNGIAVKSHGGTDEVGFANSIKVAYELASQNINDKICQELSYYEELNGGNGLEEELEEA
jgi:glycerol-3-phosphate acyltransferase PlsX